MPNPSQIADILRLRTKRFGINYQVHRLASQVSRRAKPDPQLKPIIFFNASSRLVGISLNAAFSELTSLALRLQKVPVVHFVCQAGMSRCVLGTDQNDFSKLPPCKACIAQSRWLYSTALTIPLTFQDNPQLRDTLASLSLGELMGFEYPMPENLQGSFQASTLVPLGQLVLPAIRWVLRRHHLPDDEPTRFLFTHYILSAYQLAQSFSILLDQTSPQAVVVFNGQFFPEATARWLALQRGIRTITHEVGLQPYSAFFTTGEATAYPLHVPDDFDLNEAQNDRLDTYLSRRFQGQFSMAGIHFWPEMVGLDDAFNQKAAEFKQIVPIFTNVIFDTSQPHSNVVFPHMFAWLDLVLQTARSHPETLFVLRAHPDEARPGKASQESVAQWVAQSKADSLANLVFVDSTQPLSSYELIQRSKFVMVYNSTIGLEASIMGAPVLCAGRARFTQLPTVFFPATQEQFQYQLSEFLAAEAIPVPAEFKRNARRFLYYQLYRSSLPFGDFLEEDGIWQGFVRLKKISPQSLSPDVSPTMKTILDGIRNEGDFLLNVDL